MIAKHQFPKRPKALDIGCGPGQLAIELERKGFAATGIDFSNAMINLAKDNAKKEGMESVDFKIGEVESLGFPDCTFDLITGLGILEYLENDQSVLEEVNRVLNVGGIFITNITNIFSYQNIFEPLYRRIKRSSTIRHLLTSLKSIVTESQESFVTEMDFAPRKHKPYTFLSSLRSFDFEILEDKFIGFSVFPSPLNTLSARLTSPIDRRLEGLDGTMLRLLGACYIVCAKSIRKC